MFTTIPMGLAAIPFLAAWYRLRRREASVSRP
jgi:hypothetical protein